MLEETVEAKVEHDKYVAALEAVKKQDNNLYKQVEKAAEAGATDATPPSITA
jgi:hypothetical protein